MCISETWLSPDTPNEHIIIPNYNVYRSDKGRGGGVCIYVRDVLKVTPVNFDIVRPEGRPIEDVWLSVQSRKLHTVIIGCLYRHPKSFSCNLTKKTFYVLGDFNDNLLSNDSRLRKIIENSKVSQVIMKATRITPNSATLLDIIVTNNAKSVIQSDVIPCHVADHELITVTVNLRKEKRIPNFKTFRDLRFYSPDLLYNLLLQEVHQLDKILTTDNVETQGDIFTTYFMKCLNECAPLVTKKVRRPPAP